MSIQTARLIRDISDYYAVTTVANETHDDDITQYDWIVSVDMEILPEEFHDLVELHGVVAVVHGWAIKDAHLKMVADTKEISPILSMGLQTVSNTMFPEEEYPVVIIRNMEADGHLGLHQSAFHAIKEQILDEHYNATIGAVDTLIKWQKKGELVTAKKLSYVLRRDGFIHLDRGVYTHAPFDGLDDIALD